MADRFSEYEQAITFLAGNTVIQYRGEELRPRGDDQPSFDLSQVCCWVSEQPLTNGRYLCTRNDANGNIKLISEPSSGDMDISSDEESFFIPIGQSTVNDLLLISGDCYAGLLMSFEDFANDSNQQLIKNPSNPDQFVHDPLNFAHYIWPHFSYSVPEMQVDQEEVRSVSNNSRVQSQYNASDCFIYSNKTAAVLKTPNFSNGTTTPDFDKFEAFVFVEANPSLPQPLFTMAENTIRLFRLNSLHYQNTDPGYHTLNYRGIAESLFDEKGNLYEETIQESYLDDLRLLGRMNAFKRARKSLDQLRNLRNLALDMETIDTVINQYRILMELTGYRSVWAMVFNSGGDPGGFNDILGGIPAPVAPIPIGDPGEMENEPVANILDLDPGELSFGTLMGVIISAPVGLEDPGISINLPAVRINAKRVQEELTFWEEAVALPGKRQVKRSRFDQAMALLLQGTEIPVPETPIVLMGTEIPAN